MCQPVKSLFPLVFLALVTSFGTPVAAATFSGITSGPFGTFNDVEFVRYTGRFAGTTTLGAYDVPFEIVAPRDLTEGSGAILFEAPHFLFGPLGRDFVLGRQLVFGRGLSYASVGWAGHGLSVLDSSAAPIILAGEEVNNPGVPNPASTHDFELITQFVNSLKTDPDAVAILGDDQRFYSFGLSQTSSALLQIFLGSDGPGLFDFNLITLQFWPSILGSHIFDKITDTFVPPTGIGRTMIINTEGEIVVSDAEQLRITTSNPNYRIYEVSGASHFPLPPPFNPLDATPFMRALFVAGDNWARWGMTPPDDSLIAETSGIDPIYGLETGIARDSNGNALGGIRRPEVEVGQATYIASLLDVEVIPGLPSLVGAIIDLTCEPLPDGSVRFPSHGDYVSRFTHQTNLLVNQGYLLPADAEAMKENAAESDIGKPGSCQ